MTDVCLSTAAVDALADYACRDVPTPRRDGETFEQWMQRVRSGLIHGVPNPPADLSWWSDAEIVAAVRRLFRVWSGGSVTDIPVSNVRVMREHSGVLVTHRVLTHLCKASEGWALHTPLALAPGVAEHIALQCPGSAFVQFRPVVGGVAPRPVHARTVDPRRVRWGWWSDRGYAEMSDLFPREVHVTRILRPVVRTPMLTSDSCDEVVWLAESDIGLVTLRWWWWYHTDPTDRFDHVPYGPTVRLPLRRGHGYVEHPLVDAPSSPPVSMIPGWAEMPYHVQAQRGPEILEAHKRLRFGGPEPAAWYHQLPTHRELPAWMLPLIQEDFAALDVREFPLLLPHNPEHDRGP